MKRNRTIEIIAVIVIAVVLVGEIIVYTSGTDDYDVDMSISSDELEYSVSVNGSQPYSVVAMDSGGMEPMTEIYVFYDETYASDYLIEEGRPIGSAELDQSYYIDQLAKTVAYRGGADIRIMNASELKEAMEKDMMDSFQKGLVILSGGLPDTIYTGNSTDPVFEWLDKGGRLYWAGNLIGAYISTSDGMKDAPEGHQELFFGAGADCLNSGDGFFASADTTGNSLRYDLSLQNNNVRYGVDVSGLPAGTEYLAMGYTDGTYDSIVMTKLGDGMVCVIGGGYSREQYWDLAQILCSNIGYSTEIIDVATGSVRYGTATGTIDVTGRTDITAYVYLGGYYPVYGKFFSFL